MLSAQVGIKTFHHINTRDGLSNSQVNHVIKDHDGYMWIATADGLNKFDGVNFSVYRNEEGHLNSLPSDVVLCLFEDHLFNLWVGTSAGLCRYDKRRDDFERIDYPTDENWKMDGQLINCIYEDKDHLMWIGTSSYVYNLDIGKKLFHREFRDYFKNNGLTCTSIAGDKKGNIWFSLSSDIWGGAFCYSKTTKKLIRYDKDGTNLPLPSNAVQCLALDADDRVWCGMETAGAVRLDLKKKNVEHFGADNKLFALNHNTVRSIAIGAGGLVYLGSELGMNIFDFTKNKCESYKTTESEHSLPNNSIKHIYNASDGSLWVSTYAGGIAVYDKRFIKFDHYKHQNSNDRSLGGMSVSSFTEDQNGHIWISSDGGGISFFNQHDHTFKNFASQHGDKKTLTNDKVLSVLADKQGDLWAGMWQGGLNRFKIVGDQLVLQKKYDLLDPNNKNSFSVFKIFQSSDGTLWIGSFSTGLFVYDRKNDRFDHIDLKDAQNKSIDFLIVMDLLDDGKGNLWIATQGNGLFCYSISSKQCKIYTPSKEKSNCINSSSVNALLKDQSGRLWAGTADGGLNLFDDKTNSFVHFLPKDGLPNKTIKGILEDRHGFLWISTNVGISRLKIPNTLPLRISEIENFTMQDGLQDKNFNLFAYYKSKQGKMFFGGIVGFNVFHPDSLMRNPEKPPVRFTDFLLFNKHVPIGEPNSPLSSHLSELKKIELTHDQSLFTFKFVALNYIFSGKNEYAYKMEGFDKEWNQIGNKLEATYTNLDPGEYVFRVKACNNDGLWNEEGASIQVVILPPWWKTVWFRFFSAFFVIGSSLAFYFNRINNLKQQKKILEVKVNERTAELKTAHNDLQNRHEEILQQQDEIMAQRDEIMLKRDELELKNTELQQQKEEVSNAYHIIKLKSEAINSSIRYALTIQRAILPLKDEIDRYFDSFIIFKPKDVVSGDFYWYAHKEGDIHIFATVDCTGHGVPGAFMSMVGNRLLNEIIIEEGENDPGKVLTSLNLKIKKALKQEISENHDGMDVCLCCFRYNDEGKVDVSFSGAKRPLFWYQRSLSKLELVAGNRKTIGGVSTRNLAGFVSQYFTAEIGDTFYLSTDGFTDQNNNLRKRFGTERLFELFSSISHFPMNEVSAKLQEELLVFQGNQEQRDDITVLGVRLIGK